MGGPPHLLAGQSQLEAGVILREHRLADDAAYARLISLVMTAAYSEETLRERRERYAHKQWHVRIAEVDGTVAAVAELVQSGAGAFAMCRIVVDPNMRGQGIGTSLLNEVADHPLYNSAKVFAQTSDDDDAAVRFVERAGFRREAHVFESHIDPSLFDIAPYQPLIEGVKASGLRIATLEELGADNDSRYKLWELEHVTDLDIPGLDPDHLPSWEDAKRSWYQSSWYDPAAEFIALEGDRFVGASAVAEMAPGTWSILHTCTLRDYRGRGIATALKALTTEYAKQKGSRLLKTNNHSGNAAMLSINQRFGFQPLPGWFEYTKFKGLTKD